MNTLTHKIKLNHLLLVSFIFISLISILSFGNAVKADTTSSPSVAYQGHVEDIGWQPAVSDGAIAGTQGQSLRMEAIKINLVNAPVDAHIHYKCHVQNIGWMDDAEDGYEGGTTNQSLRLEAIKISLENLPTYSVQYRVHVQDIGWMNWVTDGEMAGTQGQGLRVEAIQIRLIPSVNSASITLNKTSSILGVGKTDKLIPSIHPSNSTDSITWSSSTPGVASVDNNGNVTGISEGTTTITAATESGLSASCTYRVVTNPVNVTGIKLNKTTDSILLRSGDNLIATVTPTNATDTNVNWVSSDEHVATVANGVVTAVNLGTTTITAVTEDGNKTASCVVTINPIPVTGIKLNKNTDTLTIGDVDALSAVFTPTYSTNTNVHWASSNNSIVSVDSNGMIHALSVGSAVVTAISDDGGKTSSCVVTVKPKTVTGVTLTYTSGAPAVSDTLVVGSSKALVANVAPSDATNKSVFWSSSNSTVATVSSSGVVTAVGAGSSAGTATITATTVDGLFSAHYTVHVVSTPIYPTSITLSSTSEVLPVGTSATLTTSILPLNATTTSLTWSSNNPSVATVDPYGNILAHNPGDCIITAASTSGSCSASCSVQVVKMTLNKSTDALNPGDSDTLTATLQPASIAGAAIHWSSDNPSVAIVDAYGKVTATSTPGTAVIKATTSPAYGVTPTTPYGVTASCTVTVNPIAVTDVTLNKHSDGLVKGQTDNLIATVDPATATDPTLAWSTSNAGVAEVDTTGKVTAKSPGTAIITAASTTGISDFCVVTVTPNPYEITGVTLSSTTTTIALSSTSTLHATVTTEAGSTIDATSASTPTGDGTTSANTKVHWSSSNPYVVGVTPSGVIAGTGTGTAVITVTTDDGAHTATCTVTVD